jgi:hypothetical protein
MKQVYFLCCKASQFPIWNNSRTVSEYGRGWQPKIRCFRNDTRSKPQTDSFHWVIFVSLTLLNQLHALHILCWDDCLWMINWKGTRMNRLWFIKMLPQNLSRLNEENTKSIRQYGLSESRHSNLGLQNSKQVCRSFDRDVGIAMTDLDSIRDVPGSNPEMGPSY